MARTKLNQRSASRATVPMGATGGRTPPSKATVALFATSLVCAVWAAAMLTPPGRIAYVYLFAYSEFYMGVLTLVSLSITVMFGLVATDRMVLSIRQRVLMQSAHRTTGIIAVAALVVHVMTKFSMGYITVVDVFVPFLAANQTVYVGLGTIAGGAMVSVLWTGIVRARFAGRGKPWMWRALHSTAYLAWPIALTHGLGAGRGAAAWVVVSYIVCVLFVLIALAVRLSVSLGRRKDFASTSTGSIKPVGKLVPTAAAGVKGRTRRRDRDEPMVEPIANRVVADRSNAPAAVLDSWVPAAPVAPVSARPSAGPAAPVSARPSVGPVAPVTARPAAGPVAPVSGRPYDDVYRPPAARSRRPAGAAEQAARGRQDRYDDEDRYEADRYEEPPVPADRFDDYDDVAYDDPSYDEERYQAELRRYADSDRGGRPVRRSAGTDRYDEVTRPIARRPADDRARRYADADEKPRDGRRSEPRRYDDAQPARPRRYADEQEPVPRPRRYVESDEPAPRARRDRPVEPQRPGSRTRRHAEQEEPPAAQPRRYADDDYRDTPRPRAPRYGDAQQPATRSSRYVDDDEPGPRARRERFAAADNGRHSRGDLAPPADPWTGIDGSDVPPDETPTLIDMASRRARRAIAEAPRPAGRGNRRRGRAGDDADDLYWRQLRGEAQ